VSRSPKPGHALQVHEGVLRTVLPNGLTVLVRHDASAPVVAIVTHVKAGYFDETDDVVGIAHVLEHMYFKGTPTFGVGAIARETKLAGGWLNAHTIYDHTAYVTVLPSEAFLRGLDIQFDAFAHSLIDAEELARELAVIIQEAQRKRDAPGAVTVESLFALLHDRHRIRRWRIGDPDMLRGFTRAMVHGFYRRWYVPSNTIISVVGAVEPERALAAIAARYGMLASAPVTRDDAPRETAPPGVRVQELSGDLTQAHVAFGWRTPSQRHPQSPALDLAGVALGTGRASRLYRAVREQQLASGVSAYQYSSADLGVFVVHVESPAPTLTAAMRATWREVQQLRTHPLGEAEVLRAQRILEARWMRRLETMDGQAAYLAGWEAEGHVTMGARYYEQLLGVNAEHIRLAAERYLDPAQVGVLVYRPRAVDPLALTAQSLSGWLADGAAFPATAPSAPAPSAPAPSATVPPTPAGPATTPPATPCPAPIAATLPAAAPALERVQHGVHVYRTRRAVPVLIQPRAGAPMVNVGVFLRGGAVSEPVHAAGIARLMAHATLAGTRRRTGAQIALDAESLGGSVGISVGLESLAWTLSVPLRQFEAAVALLADVVQHPTFPSAGIDTERALAIAELQRLRDDMYRFPMRLASEAAYRGHPYARSVVGTTDTLTAITRDAVVAQHTRVLQDGACVVGVVGDVEPAHGAELVQQHFGDLIVGHDVPPPPAPWPTEPVTHAEERDKQQTALAMLFPGPSRRDPARYAARVLGAVVSGLGGRFFEQLRDRQSLAYSVAAYPVERRMGGLFAAYIATAPDREEEARAGLLHQFALLRNEPVGDREIERARRYLIGAHAIAQQSGASVLAELIDAWSFGDGLQELVEDRDRLRAVTTQDIQSLAQRWFNLAHRVEGVVRGRGASANGGT
jgi:zinc protease